MSSLYFQIMGFLITVLLMVVYFSKERVINKDTKIYSKLLITTFFALIFDITIVIIAYLNDLEDVTIPLWILNKFYLSSLLIWVSLFTRYIINISLDSQKKVSKIVKIGGKYLDFLSIFSIVIIFLLPIELYKKDGVMFSYGISVNFLVAMIVLHVIAILFFTFKNIKNIYNKKYMPLFILIILVILAIIMNRIDPSVLITTAAAAYVDLIMYFSIENPDKRTIGLLNDARITAEKANRAKSEFLSNMSHEIRTPLNAIVGFSDCILEETTLEAAKNDAKDIKLASENLLEIVNGILDISKIEADKMEVIESDYEPEEIFENIVKLVKPRLGEKPVELKSIYASNLPYMLHGDGSKLKQIVTNILTNAAKYTDAGTINFFVNCINGEDRTKLIISVEDTGRGIKPEQMDKLFSKFQRLDEDRNSTLEGTGLGLAITKRLLELLGGTINVESTYGVGSKFTVTLEQKIVLRTKPETKVIADLNGMTANVEQNFANARVLVVDDNKINLKVAVKLLSNYGIKPDFVESGFECIDRVLNGAEYDLILLDDMMPKMSGVETLKKLKEIEGFDMPVVALTANAISGMKEKYLADGFNDYISKPIDKEELLRVLNEFLK